MVIIINLADDIIIDHLWAGDGIILRLATVGP